MMMTMIQMKKRTLTRSIRVRWRWIRRQPAFREESAATMLEWALLLAAIGLPSYWIIKLALNTLVAHYQMMTTINSLPFP